MIPVSFSSLDGRDKDPTGEEYWMAKNGFQQNKGFPSDSVVKNLTCNAGDAGSITGSGGLW